MKIAVGASSFGQPEALAMLKGYEIALNPYGRKMTDEETVEHLHGASGLLAGLELLDEKVFKACPSLKAIARVGSGMDNVDLVAAKRGGVKVSNTPDTPAYAVAEMTLSALLCIARQVIPANSDMHNGIWDKRIGFSLRGTAILLVGYGRIAKELERLLEPFDANVIKYDPLLKGHMTLPELLPQAKVVSLHASGREQVIGEGELSIVEDGTILLNSARGGLVDENAVYAALKNGKLSWYWADVFLEEPYLGKLMELENALLTPHISTYTEKCRREMEVQAVKNLLEDLSSA